MNLIAICIAFIVSIVSVGAPLVFQVVTKLNKDYNSQAINTIFEKESRINWFKWLLIVTLIVVGAYMIISALYLSFDLLVAYKIIEQFSVLLIVPSALLVGLFVYFSFVTLKFSKPTSLLLILIKKDKAEKYKNDIIESLIDFSINAIQKKNLPTFREITNHFIDAYDRYKKNNKSELLPEKLYEIGYRITKELASNKDRDFDQFKQLTINNLWLIDNLNSSSDVWLWRNLIIAVENKEDEMVLYYWKRAFQHFEYNLRIPDAIYSIPLSIEKENQAEIDQIKEERSEFLDFHYYLGGLLLYEIRIECILRIWNHTNSEPPHYPLLPSTLGEIFTKYFNLCQIFDKDLWERAAKFNFPRVESVNFDWVVNSWIRKYLILLFLRQYTLQSYYTFDDFLELPNSPETQAKKKHWIDNIQRFIDGLKDVLVNVSLLKELQLDHITEERCKAEKKIYPLELIDNFKSQLENDFGQTNINQPVSTQKERKFWTSSKEIIEDAIVEYDDVINKTIKIEDINCRKPFYIAGNNLLALKSDFAGDQPYDHWNYHSLLAEQVANKMRWAISETFLMVTTQGYLLKEEDLFKAIDNLKITENQTILK